MTLPTSGLITINDRGARAATTFGSVEAGGGNMVFIKKLTASSSGTLSFVDGASSVVLDSTYKEYIFTFKNIHAATDEAHLTFNMSVDGGSNYNVTKTSTSFQAYHRENDEANPAVAYSTSHDLAQGTGFQNFIMGLGTDADQNGCGSLHLFNPSSTTFVKHFISVISNTEANDYATQYNTAGYGNTTSAVDAIQFKMSSGNIDAGDICLYGIL
jgi:hypothetical protein